MQHKTDFIRCFCLIGNMCVFCSLLNIWFRNEMYTFQLCCLHLDSFCFVFNNHHHFVVYRLFNVFFWSTTKKQFFLFNRKKAYRRSLRRHRPEYLINSKLHWKVGITSFSHNFFVVVVICFSFFSFSFCFLNIYIYFICIM